jgi:hypothetical protein
MGLLNLALIGIGVVLMGFGYARAQRPWARYKALKAEDANIARYESWRGGLRDSGTTGASVAMEVLRKQARDGAIISAAGVVITILGFLVK